MILIHLSACVDVDSTTLFKNDCNSLINSTSSSFSFFSEDGLVMVALEVVAVLQDGSLKYNGMKPNIEINTRNCTCLVNFRNIWDRHCMYSLGEDGGSSDNFDIDVDLDVDVDVDLDLDVDVELVEDLDRMEVRIARVRSMDVNGWRNLDSIRD